MSNRSLIEIDHDKFYEIEKDPQGFVNALLEFMRNPWNELSPIVPTEHIEEMKDTLRDYGVTTRGTRHHSDPFHIQWGYGPFQDDRGIRR